MSSPLSRRAFLRTTAVLGTGLVAAPFLAARPRRDVMDRIALTTVTFRFRFAATRPAPYAGTESLLTLLEIPAYFTDRFGVRNLELWSQHFEAQSRSYLRDLRRAVARADARIVNIQVDQPYNLAAADDDERQRSIALVQTWVDTARTLGAPSIRANAGSGAVETSIASLRTLHAYAQARGILLLTENHGGISTDLDVLLQILNAFPRGTVRAVADFGNFPAGADRYTALARLMPYTHLISAKTQVFDADGAHTSFDFDRCVQTAEQAGFRGIYSGEQWDPSTDPLDAEYIADWMIARIRANLSA